jgi:UDP-4-amino-4,6-dideoxy-N-acetyl-beta-L-altrosamine transaminase
MSGSGFLPYGRQSIDQADIDAVVDVLRSPFLTQGPAVDRFEAAIAAETGAPHAVACSNGTTALHLACVALGLGPGDAAIVPAITFMATANAARYTGAEVVFADVDPDSGLMGPGEAEAALATAAARGLRAKVLMPVHLAGQPADPVGMAALAHRHGLAVIEDGCHAIGTRYTRPDGRQAAIGNGATASCTAFSFHPVKTVATGEGGALTTADTALAERLRRLRSHGIVREAGAFANHDMAFAPDGSANPWYHEMAELGFNYRLSDLQAALGLSQMGRIRAFVGKRQDLVACYDRLLAPLAPGVRPLARAAGASPAWHLYVALIDFAALGIDRATVMNRLRDRGIGSQVHYIPVPEQPYYRSRYGRPDLPGAQRYYGRALSLPLFPAMDEADVGRVVTALADALAEVPP